MPPVPIQPPSSLCYLCIADNTPQEQQGHALHINCDICDRPYCNNHASILESTSCQGCLNDFNVIKKDESYTGIEVYLKRDPRTGLVLNDENDQPIVVRKPYHLNYRQIMVMGNDWLFSQVKMSNMTEPQCETSLEWHRVHVSYLEMMINQHKAIEAHKKAQVKVPMAQRVEKKAREKKEKSLEMLAASLQSMKPEDLAALMQRLQESVGGHK